MFSSFVNAVREAFGTTENIPLHEPVFTGNERDYLIDTVDSTFVSSIGAYVDRFEAEFAAYTGSAYAISTVNGTAALHIALELAGCGRGDEVVTQPLSFVATANAIAYTGAAPVFVDVDRDTLGMSPAALAEWLAENAEVRNGECINRNSNRRIRACVPMHTFGHVSAVDELARICDSYNIVMIEDAAEAVGSWDKGVHAGRTGLINTFSFNGNKIITTGGGGMITTDDKCLARKAKHLTTTAKQPHAWEYRHDTIAYNFRMPNLNAAMGCAQLEQLPKFLTTKRSLHEYYQNTLTPLGFRVLQEPPNSNSNFWLNAVVLNSRTDRDEMLSYTNSNGVMTRPVWGLLNEQPMFDQCECGTIPNATWLADRIVNIPSSATADTQALAS